MAQEVFPQSNEPIGTLDEIRELGLDPSRVGTCSKRAGKNVGCPWFNNCRFHQWRDGLGGRKGPLNVGVDVILGPIDGGAWDQKQMPCFQFYASGLAARAKNTDESGEVIRVIAYEGDDRELNERITVRENPNDPNDKRMLETVETRRVQVFPRPAQRYPVVVKREQARLEALDEIEAEALRKALDRTKQPGVKVAEPVGAPRKVEKANG